MLNEASAMIKGIKEISGLFGLEYVKKHKNAPICKNVSNNILTMSYLFQNSSESRI